MYRIALLALFFLIITAIAFTNYAKAEEIHFNNNIFILKYSAHSQQINGYENEYFFKDENKNNWTKMVGIYYYPEEGKPIKFADDKCKQIENNENNVLLKFIKNKKADKAALSYLQHGNIQDKNFFEYNIFKYEKHPDKGMMVLRYAVRYFFTTDAEITKIGNNVKEENDKYLQMIIESPIPPIIEKDITSAT